LDANVTYKAIAALAVALAFYLAGPQWFRAPSAANAAEKQYRLVDLGRLCDAAAGGEWPKYYQKDNILIRDGYCHINDILVFSDQNCVKSDSATFIPCLRTIVGHEFEVATSEGKIAGPPCKAAGLCTYYFDFYDPATNYLKGSSHPCGFHIGGVAKVTEAGQVAFWGSVSIKNSCTQ
jgi:hypothetical protein